MREFEDRLPDLVTGDAKQVVVSRIRDAQDGFVRAGVGFVELLAMYSRAVAV